MVFSAKKFHMHGGVDWRHITKHLLPTPMAMRWMILQWPLYRALARGSGELSHRWTRVPERAFQLDTAPDTSEGNFEKKMFKSRSCHEPTQMKRARLLYQSRKRGILENDLLLATFAKEHLDSMSKEELEMYDRLINTISNEWDLYYFAVGTREIPPEYDNSVMHKLVEHARNENRQLRIRQPDL